MSYKKTPNSLPKVTKKPVQKIPMDKQYFMDFSVMKFMLRVFPEASASDIDGNSKEITLSPYEIKWIK